MAGSAYFGFNTTQAKTLERLMNSGDAGLSALAAAVQQLQKDYTALEARVADLETP